MGRVSLEKLTFYPDPFSGATSFAEWPQFCDHSVTSADVRLSVGPKLSRDACQRPVDFASLRRELVANQNATSHLLPVCSLSGT
jgi:hypothetical protein